MDFKKKRETFERKDEEYEWTRKVVQATEKKEYYRPLNEGKERKKRKKEERRTKS